MNRQRLSHAACLLTAIVLKAAQRVCLPLVPDAPLTAAQLAGDGLFLLVALGVGLGIAACCLALDGRGFAGLYLRCAGLCLLCRIAGLLLWQLVGGHWVVALYASEVVPLLVCSWQIGWAANGKNGHPAENPGIGKHWRRRNAETQAAASQPSNRLQPVFLLLTLLVCTWIQVLGCRRCQPFVANSLSYRSVLQHLSLPVAIGEWLVYLVCCWLMLPLLPQAWQGKRGIISVVLLLSGSLVALGLVDGLLKPEGFLKGLSQASAITRQSLDWTAAQPWHSEISLRAVQRRQGDGKEDRECLRLLTLRDQHGRTAARALLTEPLTAETLLLEGQTVELLHPYGLLLPAGDTLQLIRLADLPAQEKHPLLTAFCQARLADFRLLPAVGGYLLRHQPEATQPLLERYLAADFTPEELAAMGDIAPQWVSRTARRLLAP